MVLELADSDTNMRAVLELFVFGHKVLRLFLEEPGLKPTDG
jgi:hypothetical protein